MNVTGRIVAESYKLGFNRAPDLIFWVRTEKGRQKVSIPSPYLPREEAVIADEQEEAVTKIEVHDPPGVAIHRKALEGKGFNVFEADLPYCRLMKKVLGIYHNKISIREGEIFSYEGEVPGMVRGYYDIECDDTDMKKTPKPGTNRLICVTLVIVYPDGRVEEFTFTGDDEVKDILKPLLEKLQDVDLLIGWGSEDFDDDFIDTRMRMFQLDWNPKSIQRLDLMKVIQFRGGKRLESQRLDYVVNEFLVKERGWYKETIQRLKGYNRYFKNQGGKDEFGNEINRDTMQRVNASHARAVKDIDRAMEFSELRISLADVGGIQVADTYYQSRVIDSLVLRRFYNERPRLIARCRDENVKKERYKGAQVFDTIPGQHDNVLHFVWSEARKAAPKDYEELIPLLQSQKEGIFPQEMRKLEIWRAELKAEKVKYEADKTSAEYKKASMMDNTVKTLILAFYGQLGEPRSRYFVNLMAGLVTYGGRELILGTAKELTDLNLQIIYGDTDSLFAREAPEFAGAISDFEQFGQKLKAYLNEQFYPTLLTERWHISPERKRIQIGFEEVYDTIFFGESKKRYAGWAHGATKPEVVGFEQIRSDWCPLAKTAQWDILNMRLKKVDVEQIKSYIVKLKSDLLDGKYGAELIISKGYHKGESGYTSLPPHARAALKMTEAERQGDYKIHYVVSKAVRGAIDDVMPVVDRTKIPEIKMSARIYYWQHQIFPPTRRVLWGLFSDSELDVFESCAVKVPSRMDFWYTNQTIQE